METYVTIRKYDETQSNIYVGQSLDAAVSAGEHLLFKEHASCEFEIEVWKRGEHTKTLSFNYDARNKRYTLTEE